MDDKVQKPKKKASKPKKKITGEVIRSFTIHGKSYKPGDVYEAKSLDSLKILKQQKFLKDD